MENENVGRARHGRVTAHASVRRERAENAPPRTRGRGRSEAPEGSSSQPQASSSHGASSSHAPPVAMSQVGFPGGPSDTSLLPSFGQHVAARIWNGQEREKIPRVVNNAKRLTTFVPPPDTAEYNWFWNVINASGLSPLLKTNYGMLDHGLLVAFSERWHSETSSFHLPTGEMTITLDDVSCLLHIPVEGNMLFHESLSAKQGAEYLHQYLGWDLNAAVTECRTIKSARITYEKLLELYTNYLADAQFYASQPNEEENTEWYQVRCIRAFLLYLVGCTLFSDKTGHGCGVVYLKYFDDLTAVNQYAWGASALAFLYSYLGDLTKPECRSLSGYTCLLQAWIYEHFPVICPRDFDVSYREEYPRARRFVYKRGHSQEISYRTSLDRLVVDDIIFNPYDSHRDSHPFEVVSWYSGWLLCGRSCCHPHLPERVLRQFGYVQTIPRHPHVSAPITLSVYQMAEQFDNYTAHLVSEEDRGELVHHDWHASDGYISWLYRFSHPLLIPAVPNNPPRPANLEVLLEEEHGVDPLTVICRVKELAIQSIEDNPELEGTPCYTALQQIVSETTPATQYQLRRKRRNIRQYSSQGTE